ncbi:MAG: hypothetical protein Q9202_004757 [Teloschistes flavicans]
MPPQRNILAEPDDASSSGDDIAPGKSSSVLDGIERVEPQDSSRRRQDRSPGKLLMSTSQRTDGILQAKNEVLDMMINKLLPPEETDFMVRNLERPSDEPIRRTHDCGVPLAEVNESAIVLKVGLTFLPGADKPQVNRLEETHMAGREPHQKDASWRVNTAGSLLVQFDVKQDLQIVQTDKTPRVVAYAKQRMHDNDRYFQDHRKALALKSRPQSSVTIDSEDVRLVDDLSREQWDLQGMLIEVDASSLWNLMLNFRHLISKGGPDMSDSETSMVLERMIEDARRLCIRSPILFRMSTRTRIISSKDTRYGVDHGPMFRTLTTSRGIREIISLSASYFNSLDSTTFNATVQSRIRRRFLQMIVLLLSLLNDDDLSEIKDFLEATYGLKSDRRSLELCILKVVPLLSINSEVFLKSLIPAIEGFPLDQYVREDNSKTWDIMVKRILEIGYLLPGTIGDLGRSELSWIVKWPDKGFKSTGVFDNLQYRGALRTMNEIPPIDLNPNGSLKEVTVVLTDGSTYIIGAEDLEKVTCLTGGRYPVQEPTLAKRSFDLIIHETQINSELYKAIQMTNSLIQKVNLWLAGAASNSLFPKLRFLKLKTSKPEFLGDVPGSGRLTKSVATLRRSTLAVAYKVDGRKISRTDALRNMARDIRILQAEINLIDGRWGGVDHKVFSNEKKELRQALEDIRGQVDLADRRRLELGADGEISDEPVAKCLYPEGSDNSASPIWHDYDADPHEESGELEVYASQTTVASVRWLSDDLIELSLRNQASKLFATPLKPVPEGFRDDEIRVNDIVSLMGQYIAVGEPECTNAREPYGNLIMTNYLRIAGMEEQNRSRRGMNRGQQLEERVKHYFK